MNCSRSSSSIARQGSVANARSESGMLSNHVSPSPSQAALSGAQRSTRVKRKPASPAAGGRAPHDARTSGRRIRLAEARLAADKTDAPDHAGLGERLGTLEQLQRDAVVDSKVSGAGADVGAGVDIDRALPAHGQRAAFDSAPPCYIRVSTARTEVDIAGVLRRLRVHELVRNPIVQQFEDDSPRQIDERGLDDTPGCRCVGQIGRSRIVCQLVLPSARNSQKTSALSRLATLTPT